MIEIYRLHCITAGQKAPRSAAVKRPAPKGAGLLSQSLLGVVVEADAALLAELAGADHLLEQRMRTILGIAGLALEDFHDGEADVEADQIAESQRTHRMIGTELHGSVDAFDGGDALGVDADGLVDHPGSGYG